MFFILFLIEKYIENLKIYIVNKELVKIYYEEICRVLEMYDIVVVIDFVKEYLNL